MRRKFIVLLFILFCSQNAFSGVRLDRMYTNGVILNGMSPVTFDLTMSSYYTDFSYSASKSGYLESSAFSRVIFSTSASYMNLTLYSNIYSTLPAYSDVGIRINGEDYLAVSPTATGVNNAFVYLGQGQKVVEIISACQTKPSTLILGTFPTSVTFYGDSSVVNEKPSYSSKMVVYGDSISVGDYSANPSLQAWFNQVRTYWNDANGTMILYGYGYGALNDDCTSTETCSATASILANAVSGATSKYVYLQRSTNDYGLNRQSADSFGTNYARLLDSIHSADADIVIYAQTAISRQTETANTFGDTLTAYRNEIITECGLRSSYCNVVDGTTIVSYPTDYNDGVHPNQAAQAKYATFIKTLLGI